MSKKLVSVEPAGPLKGRLTPPGDKSISHRSLLFNALASGSARITGLLESEDVAATRTAVEALGVTVDEDHNGLVLRSTGALSEPADVIDCGNSGTSMRLLSGALAATPFVSVLTGDASLRSRPMGRVVNPLRKMGAAIEGREKGTLAPLAFCGGTLEMGNHQLKVASAQVKSALLLAGLRSGVAVKEPRLIQTRIGAAVDELTEGQLNEPPVRAISGSVLSGRLAQGGYAFLGRYHLQISAIADKVNRPILGWIMPGMNRYSVMPVYGSALSSKGRKFPFTSSTEGSPRAIIPIGAYEKVMPLDVIPTALLKAVASNDVERAQSLGCLEMDEEDLALCSFVCPGKHDFGSLLRQVLTNIEKEG